MRRVRRRAQRSAGRLVGRRAGRRVSRSPDGAAVSASTLSVELSVDVERDVRVVHVLEVVSKSFVLILILNSIIFENMFSIVASHSRKLLSSYPHSPIQ